MRIVEPRPRRAAPFVNDPAGERDLAKLGWLLAVLRYAIAAVWIATAIVSAFLFPEAQSYHLLERTGVPAACGSR